MKLRELDGGPAFPLPPVNDLEPRFYGMSLRDFFAAHALHALQGHPYHDVARRCYEIADMMLAEGDRGRPPGAA